LNTGYITKKKGRGNKNRQIAIKILLRVFTYFYWVTELLGIFEKVNIIEVTLE